ncbi:YdcF family protein [Anaerovorax odorimutans]|uniref:YdcF family protein n=1 Tax=Anaerovorax odorimutans TaxID=109327 RepID=A0ABT1RT39_9FIRM|nr:ElyC/SanA/YdcF family protein [Anaerovorax odorimutans]MCQ4638373.1 YdcF family protein [Anaerovorax odorimutans]
MEKKKMKVWKKVLLTILVLVVLMAAGILGINGYVVKSTDDRILCTVSDNSNEIAKADMDALKGKDADCILVLGALVRRDGTPSYMLQDRLDVAIKLYKAGAAPKLLLSGDHGQVRYDEVNVMKEYALEAGVPKKDIFLDHAGFSTYDSVYRAKAIFEVERVIVVTQGYHQYRALYGCEKMGIDAWGAAADQTTYRGQKMRDLREIAARDKDFVKWLFKPEPTYLGDTIPISGSGIKSQD